MPFCHSCGTDLPDKSPYCHNCGTKQGRGESTTPRQHGSSSIENPWLAALIGSLIGFFAAIVAGSLFLPLYVFGIFLGGIIAGYLTISAKSGITVGAVSGIFATAPIALLLLIVTVVGISGFALGIISEMTPGAMGGGGFALIAFVTLFLVVLSVITNVLFGALGGFIGQALAEAD